MRMSSNPITFVRRVSSSHSVALALEAREGIIVQASTHFGRGTPNIEYVYERSGGYLFEVLTPDDDIPELRLVSDAALKAEILADLSAIEDVRLSS